MNFSFYWHTEFLLGAVTYLSFLAYCLAISGCAGKLFHAAIV